jgi:hypothetical protein
MTELQTVELMSDVQRQINLHVSAVCRLENDIKRLEIIKVMVSRGRIDKKLLQSVGVLAPVYLRDPRDCNGSTQATDAIRLCIQDLPKTFSFQDVRAAVARRFSHVKVNGRNFVNTFAHVRRYDPNIRKAGYCTYEHNEPVV